MNSLKAFEAVARHCSMTSAATELCVSHSAVSRHITQLENYLQERLFERKGRGLNLTPRGVTYAAELKYLFDRIEAVTHSSFDSASDNVPLQINVEPTFALRWMAPRLAGFHREHPNIPLQLHTVYDNFNFPTNFERSDADFAIGLGHGKWPGLHSIHLFDEILVPACSPQLTGPLKNVDDLRNFVLLHSQHRADDWAQWLRSAGATEVDPRSGLRLGNSYVAIEAASYGLGITMAQAGFVCDDLKRGQLIPLFEQKRLQTNRSFYAVCSASKRSLSKISVFCSWLDAAAKEFSGQLADLFSPHSH